MGIAIRRRGVVAKVIVDGAANVACVAELRDVLASLLAEGRGATLDLASASHADTAFFQLVTSARRSFAARGLAFDAGDEGALLGAAFPGCDGRVRLADGIRERAE